MTIPESVKIGGIRYKVEVVDALDVENADLVGSIDYRKQRIQLRAGMGSDITAQTLWHEILHAIFVNLGFDQDETRIEQFAAVLNALVVDNPEMFEKRAALPAGLNGEEAAQAIAQASMNIYGDKSA